MSELGEGAAAAKPVETAKKGKVKVSVRDICTGKRIEGAEVVVNGKSKKSDTQGETLFGEQNVGLTTVKVNKHFEEADYKTFITHKPKITLSHDAKSSAEDMVQVEESKESRVRIEIPVFRVVETVRFCRIHLKFSPKLDYGHWWIEVGNHSYGWWPEEGHLGPKDMEEPQPPAPLPEGADMPAQIEYMAQSASYRARVAQYAANYSKAGAYSQAIYKTFRGVPGILNGDDNYKRNEIDPHHGDWKKGKTNEDYHPVILDCRTDSEIKDAIRDFAFSYSGNWSWRFEFGTNCHTFQKDAMKKLKLDKVKEL